MADQSHAAPPSDPKLRIKALESWRPIFTSSDELLAFMAPVLSRPGERSAVNGFWIVS